MNRKIKAIAVNTYKKVYNNPIIIILIIACLALIGSTRMYKALTMGLESKLMVDVSLALINLLGVVIAVYLGANSVSEEFENRTAHILLSKPVNRRELVLGKFFGTWLSASAIIAILAVGALIIVAISSKDFRLGIITASIMMIFQVGVIASFSVWFSTFLKPATATIAATVVFIILASVYVYPGVTGFKYQIKAFNVSPDEYADLEELAGEKAEITQTTSTVPSEVGIQEEYAEYEALPPEEAEVERTAEPEEEKTAKKSYEISTKSIETRDSITEYISQRGIASSVSFGPDSTTTAISSILPDLNHLSIKNRVGNNLPTDPKRFIVSMIYGVVLMGGFMFLSLFSIKKKEIE